MEEINQLTEEIIGAAIDVHHTLGPGFLESAYETCLSFELAERGLKNGIKRGINTKIGYLRAL
jgi:GxxExxY protein